jgi:two-component system cell cycle response regulator
MQKPPDADAAVTPEGNSFHREPFAALAPVKMPLSPMIELPDKINGTILVIGDISANLDFAHTTLQSSGYHVILAESVHRAVALTEEIQPDAVLSELHMRPLDGFDLLEIAKNTPTLRGVPIVIISSTCMLERERRSCLERGAVRFVRRPIQPEALLAEIAEALNVSKRGAGH